MLNSSVREKIREQREKKLFIILLEKTNLSFVFKVSALSFGYTAAESIESNTFSCFDRMTRLFLNDNMPTLAAGFFERIGCLNLEFLCMENCSLTTIEPNAFKGMSALRILNIGNRVSNFGSHNEIALNHPDIFKGLELLTNLYAVSCVFSDPIASNILMHLTSVVEIDLSSIYIVNLKPSLLDGLHNLERVNLSGCEIKSIEPNCFLGLTRLKKLRLSNNSIETIDSTTFEGLDNLESLSLHSCRIKSIHSDAFAHFKQLKKLDLGWNRINNFDEDFFKYLTNLSKLTLNLTDLDLMKSSAFEPLWNLETLILQDMVSLDYTSETEDEIKEKFNLNDDILIIMDDDF